MIKTRLIRRANAVFGGLRVIAVILLAALCAVPAHAALCWFDKDKSTKKVTFTIPADLQVPRDTPIGAVIWESSIYNAVNPNNNYTCSTFHHWGLGNRVGGSSSSDAKNILPIGKTGLGWSLYYNYFEVDDIGHQTNSRPGGSYNPDGVRMRLYIKKIGLVEAGARVPSGLIGVVSVEKLFDSFSINTSNEAGVGTLSCKSPDVVVKMGDKNDTGQFKGVGSSLAPVNFSVAMKECPEGINKVSYLLKPNTEIVDAARSVVALDAASTAKGVGLQILDESGNPVALNKTIVFSGYDKVGGNFDIPLKAAYHQTATVVGPGTANSSVAFVMSYD
ncbi:fimbrial protein [Ralstonia mojiangensis]|uniref:fimbrial protein n=1 Tax=Ralstonia mojiangensis TaxID=2953895 RepID=UPI00209010E7|nr:fimbrial protein [Ralstonia mojiangensis]MCO5413111.1 type 1 fimbrial protein [Ralstonia mojiangensis]